MMKTTGAVLALFVCAHVHAAICTWTGAGSDDKWSNKNNWDTCQGIREIPQSTDKLIFPDGALQLTNTNDIVGLQPASLQFNGLNYDISGNAITLTPSATSGITVDTPAGTLADLGPRFRPNITLGGNQTFACAPATAKFLYIYGTLNLNGKTLGIDGACHVALRGAVSGSGNISKFGSGFAYLSLGPYSYGGIVTVNNGTLFVGTDSGLGATASGTYVESGGKLSLYQGVTTGDALSIEGGTLENYLSDNTVTGDVTLGSNSQIKVNPDTTLTIDGLVTGGTTKVGTGTLVMSNVGAPGFSAAFSVDAGLVEAKGSNMGPVTIGADATFVGSGSLTAPLVIYSGGTLWTGTRASPGTLPGTIMQWDVGGYIHSRLGKKADKLMLSGSLVKNNAGYCRFVFADGVTPPKPGTEYTLIEYSVQSGLELPNSLTYTYEGTGPGASLNGTFNVGATSLTFLVSSVVSDLVFRNGFES